MKVSLLDLCFSAKLFVEKNITCRIVKRIFQVKEFTNLFLSMSGPGTNGLEKMAFVSARVANLIRLGGPVSALVAAAFAKAFSV